MTYTCSKCGGDIRTPQFNNLMSDDWLAAALSLHEDHCTGTRHRDELMAEPLCVNAGADDA